MFCGCHELEDLNLSNFDTSKVTDMSGMFSGCFKLKEIYGINNFNTSNVIDMFGMFCECKSLEYLDLTNFEVGDICSTQEMFNGCYKLKEIKGITNFKIHKFCTFNDMFFNCGKLDYLIVSNGKILIDLEKYRKKFMQNYNTTISVMFFIPDKNIHYSIACNDSDFFSTIEKKLFAEFPELKSKNIFYIANGNVIDKSLTIKENKIKNSTSILLNYID